MTLAGTGLALAPHLRAAEGAAGAANERIQVALIGARNQGGRVLLPSLVGSDQCQLVAICDVDQNVTNKAVKKAERRYARKKDQGSFKGIQVTGDYREIMANDEIDAVVIATPDHWHCTIAAAAVMAGKDVYVEKPLSLLISEGRALADLAKEKSAIVQVGSQQRSGARFFLAEAITQSGRLGKIKNVEVAITTRPGEDDPWQPQPVPEGLDYNMWVGPIPWIPYHVKRHHYDWRFVRAVTSGEIGNWGAHFLDSAQQCLGTSYTGPVSVKGTGERHPPEGLHDTYFNIDVDFAYENGLPLKFKTGDNEITITGEDGTLVFSREGISTDPPEILRTPEIREAAQNLAKTKGSHLDNWMHCVKTRNAEDLHAPVEVGHRSVTMCHLANIAIDTGRQLNWDPEREMFRDDAEANSFLTQERRDWTAGPPEGGLVGG
jgi:predicted dehydrogenase